MSPAQSPYELAFGDAGRGDASDPLSELHPRLRAYFAAIPEGMHGIGHGTFDTVGTPRRWLRKLIKILIDADVMFPVWERNVPFTIVNVAAAHGSHPAVTGERTFHFASGDRVMRDVITVTERGLVDILGSRRRFRAFFCARVHDGVLELSSTRVELRVGRRHVPIPRFLAPHVHLEERYVDAADHQHVSIVVRHWLLGRVYEYAGSFRYELREGAQ